MLRMFLIVASWLSPVADMTASVSFWQRTLGLSDWTVIAKVVPDEVLGGRTFGDIEIDDRSKTAIVRVMRVEDSDLSRRLARAEQRFTIAHELMHLRLYVDKDPNWRSEIVVDTAVTSLIRKNGRWTDLLAIEHE